MKSIPNDDRIGFRGEAFDYALTFLVIMYVIGFFIL